MHHLLEKVFFCVQALTLACSIQLTFLSSLYADGPAQSQTPAKKLIWAEQRDVRLAEVKKEREASKNIRRTRLYLKKMSDFRSAPAGRLASKKGWLSSRFEDLIVFYETGDSTFSEPIGKEAEKAYHKALSTLGQPKLDWRKPIEIYLVRDKTFFENSGELDPLHPNSFSLPWEGEIFIDIGEPNAEAISRHHIAHVVFREFLDTKVRSGAPLPLWLDEGFAVLEEKAEEKDHGPEKILKEDEILPLVEILRQNKSPESEEKAAAFRTEWGILTEFLIDKYSAARFQTIADVLLSSGALYAYRENKNTTADQARQSFEFLIKSTVLSKDFISFEKFDPSSTLCGMKWRFSGCEPFIFDGRGF